MKTVLITGANSGFGFLTALTFARNEYKVYATTRSLEKDGVKELNEIAQKENLNIEWVVLDVTNQAQIDEAFKSIPALDVVVNNAGYGMVGEIDTFSGEDFLSQLDTNTVGQHRIAIAALPAMKKRGEGKIINLASIAGKVTYQNYGIYSASKFAVEGYTEALRIEMRKYNIDVALVEPGTFNTNFSKNIISKDLTEKEAEQELNPVIKLVFGMFKNSASPQKVADTIFRISQKRVMKLHNPVGRDGKMLAFLRKIFPEFFWDFLTKILTK